MWEGISETILRTMALVLALIATPALAYRRYSLDYVDQETDAQAARCLGRRVRGALGVAPGQAARHQSQRPRSSWLSLPEASLVTDRS